MLDVSGRAGAPRGLEGGSTFSKWSWADGIKGGHVDSEGWNEMRGRQSLETPLNLWLRSWVFLYLIGALKQESS